MISPGPSPSPQYGMGGREVPGLGPEGGEYLQPRDISELFGPLPMQSYGRPQRKKKSNPSLDDVKKKAESDVKFWETRQKRMQEHEEDVRLKKKTVTATEEAVTLNDPLSILIKMTGMCSKLEENIEFRARQPKLKQSAQSGENALRSIRSREESEWSDGLHNPIKFDEFQSLFLRGWACKRILFDSEAAAEWDGDPYSYYPWRIDFIDPANVFPNAASKFTRITHRYSCTLAELRDNSDLDTSDLDDYEDSKDLKVTGVYEVNNRFDYHCVYADCGGQAVWLKKPSAIGYMPWVIGLAGGFFFRDTPWQDASDDYTEFMGVGILHALHQLQQYLNRYFSMLATMAGDTANPFTAIMSDNPEDEPPQEGFVKGGHKRFRKDTRIERITRHERGAEGLVIPLIQGLEQRQEKSSLIRAMWGMGGEGAADSGFQTSFFIAVAHDIIFPYIRSWELFQQKCYEKVLEIFKEYAPLDIPLMVYTPPDPQSQEHSFNEFWPNDVSDQGTSVQVSLDPMTVQDKINLGQLVVGLVDKNIISRETARGVDFLRIKDPKLEDNKILAELIKLDPRVVEFLASIAASQTGEDLMANIFNMLHGQEMQGMVQQAQSGQPGMLPGQTASPAAQGQSQFDQQNARGQQVPQGGPAVGGVGVGGQPPRPPMTNQPY